MPFNAWNSVAKLLKFSTTKKSKQPKKANIYFCFKKLINFWDVHYTIFCFSGFVG
jgi:hypothetical protein